MSFSKLNQNLDTGNSFTSKKEQLKQTLTDDTPEVMPVTEVVQEKNPNASFKPSREDKKTVSKSFTLQKYVMRELEHEAEREGMSVSKLLTDILSERYFGRTYH